MVCSNGTGPSPANMMSLIYVICSVLRGMVLTKTPEVYNELQKNLISDLILIKKLTELKSLTLPQS